MTLRRKFLLTFGVGALTLIGMVILGAWTGIQQTRTLDVVQQDLIPRLESGPRLEGLFERLGREMQDAVAAQDEVALRDARAIRDEMLRAIGALEPSLETRERTALATSLNAYFEQASDVSSRMIRGETGESLIEAASAMQIKHHEVKKLLEGATRLGPNELASRFASIQEQMTQANQLRFLLGVGGVFVLLAFSEWTRRAVIRPLRGLSDGFSRFGLGNFALPIPVTSDDELGMVAREANQMAMSLDVLASERDHQDWVRSAMVGLSESLRGGLEPVTVASEALLFLSQKADARAGAIYMVDETGRLRRASHFALSQHGGDEPSPSSDPGDELQEAFAPNEGLLGQCFTSDEVLSIFDPPQGYFKVRSSLGEADASSLLFVPLSHAGKRLGVLELAFFTPCSRRAMELLEAARGPVASTLEVAQSRSRLEQLLEQSRRQSERLAVQEEELRVSNRDLEAQQEQLREANHELDVQRQALSQRNAELEAARRRVQLQVEELARVSSYKSQFLANMSHELRTPLNSMLLLSHLLAENDGGNLTEKQVEHCRTIHGAGQDLLGLINQVLDLAKIEAGKEDVKLEQVPVVDFGSHVRRVFEPLAKQKGLELIVEAPRDVPDVVVTDRARVDRILTNLVGNAIKFTETGSITVSFGRPGSDLRARDSKLTADRTLAFSVTDTGIGIPADALARVFSPFEQVASTLSQRHTGTGLGLSIARESAMLLGGELLVQSRPGEGSTFTLLLPEQSAQPSDRPLARETPRPRAAPVRSDAPARSRTLLVVEDDAAFAEQLAQIIRDRGLDAAVARTGEEALSLARSMRPLGIVLDVRLPDTTGWELMDQFRNDDQTRSIPVHFLSAVDGEARSRELGAVGFSRKPASRADLVALVQTLTARATDTRRVLVVEDSRVEGESLVHLLNAEALPAEHVTSAVNAFDAVGREAFACIVVDLGLPDMDGVEFLKAMRERPDLPNVPMIVHTGRPLNRDELRELGQYANAVVLKGERSTERLIEEVKLFIHHVDADGRQNAKIAPAPDISLTGTKLLLVDDDMRTAYALSAFLRGKGAEVVVADTGSEALVQIDQHPDVDAVIMDVMMPEMDGYTAIGHIRAQGRFQHLPIVTLTARAMKGEREKCLEAGANDYLPKPVDGGDLLRVLSKALAARPSDGRSRP